MGPLTGLRVVELASIGPGPLCAMLLADLGAEVLRIDRTEPSGLGVPMDTKFDVSGRNRRSVALDIKQMHRATVPTRHARCPPEQLGHHCRRRRPNRQRCAVIAVRRKHVVASGQRIDRTDVGRLLTNRQMAVAANASPRVLLLRTLLKATNQEHLTQQPECVLRSKRARANRFLNLRHQSHPPAVRAGPMARVAEMPDRSARMLLESKDHAQGTIALPH